MFAGHTITEKTSFAFNSIEDNAQLSVKVGSLERPNQILLGRGRSSNLYVNCPEEFNQDIYRLKKDLEWQVLDGPFLYWYNERAPVEGCTCGSWRTSGGPTRPGCEADPASQHLGSGGQYPAFRIPLAEQYTDFGSGSFFSGWSMTFT